MRTVFYSLLVLFLFCSSGWGDSFDDLKKSLHDAGCMKARFVTYTTSELFATVDTVPGEATLSADGRYHVRLGDDEFLLDSLSHYSYSKENNQVVIRKREETSMSSELLVLRELDASYRTAVITPLVHYRLTRKDSVDVAFPETLEVRLTKGGRRLKSVSYVNENGDSVVITFESIETTPACTVGSFHPSFPPDVERVKL